MSTAVLRSSSFAIEPRVDWDAVGKAMQHIGAFRTGQITTGRRSAASVVDKIVDKAVAAAVATAFDIAFDISYASSEKTKALVFWCALGHFCDKNAIEAGIDYVLDEIEACLDEGDTSLCDMILAYGPSELLPIEFTLAILTATAPASGKLAWRTAFYDKTAKSLVLKYGDRKASRLLMGLS